MTAAPPLRILHASELDQRSPETRWLVRDLWPWSAVGIVGGQPKTMKSWLGLELATAVASGAPCLGHFAVERPGPVLIYLAEDALAEVRTRLDGLCRFRGLTVSDLDLHVVAEPMLRLDLERDRARLRNAVADRRPHLLVLDPLVRLHRLNENDAQEISGLLGYLRELQREHDVSILLVHHASKKARARHGQALRGSSDLHAWTDVGAFLTWHGDRLQLTVEHRTAPAPEALELELISDETSAHLEITSAVAPSSPAPLSQRVLVLLRGADQPLRRAHLRSELRVNNARLGKTLEELEHLGLAARSPDGWSAAPTPL